MPRETIMVFRVEIYLDQRLFNALRRVQGRQQWSRSHAGAYLIEKGLEAKFPSLLEQTNLPAEPGLEA